jgi:lactoylglutathione lyase
MAIRVLSISHWALNVRDMKSSFAFYCDLLGFKHVHGYEREGKPWIEYVKVAKNQFIELFYPGENMDFYADLTSFNHLCLQVRDIRQIEKVLNEAGWPIDVPPKQGKDLNWQMWSHDPDGNKIELMQINPESLQAKS